MIRDPSDGSVKDVLDHHAKPLETGVDQSKSDGLITTGLPDPSPKTEYLERLGRSRKWLSDYRTNPERTARLMGETGEWPI